MNNLKLGSITFGPSTIFGETFKDFDKVFVGFDEPFNKIARLHDDLTKNIPNYPPYNIRKTGENTYSIEIAVAGFSRHDIEIELADDKLIIKGSAKDDGDNFIYKGIANRAFTRTFALNDQIEVKDAEMINGMLRVFLEKIIPDHKKPRKIEVREQSGKKASRQLLTEDVAGKSL